MLASTETVTIKGEEEKAKAGMSETFLQFLESKGYIKEDTTDVLDVEKLTGGKQALGNGEDTDIYKIELKDGNYEVNYYGEKGETKNIWSIASKDDGQGSATLEPDTGKEALILVYKVQPGDIIELPYFTTYYDGENEYPATFNFTVDWGDGTTDTITTDTISGKAVHPYNNLDTEKEIKISITGTFESIASTNEENVPRQGIEKLVRVEQWGTTGIKTLGLFDCTNLTELAEPTESSFKDLSYVYFEGSGITSIPDKMFMNCTKITSFERAFNNCNNLTTIGNNAFANCSSAIGFLNCFDGCTSLETIGDYAFVNCSNVQSFENNFEDCTNLRTIGNYAFANCNSAISFQNCFNGSTNLETIGDYAFANCSSVTSFELAFYGCSNLETIGDYAFANCSSVESFRQCFYGCTSLETIGEHMFEGCESVKSYEITFHGCTSLTGKAPELWLTGTNSEGNYYAGEPDGRNCFLGCTGLENYDDIPDYWKNTDD